jgi:hypothetical protein
MADQAKKKRKARVEPEMSDAMAAAMEAARQRVEERKGQRAASDVVKDNKAPRKTFSLRLDARELHRLRVLALLENEGVTELARRLVLDGISRLEAKHLADSADAQLAALVEQLSSDVVKVVLDTLTGAAAPASVRDALKVVDGRPETPETARRKRAI